MRQLILVVLTLAGFLGLGLTQFSSPPTPVHAEMVFATATRTPTPINVGNFVWDDIDHDGRQDAGEPGLAGVTVQLWNGAMNDFIDSTVTNANGNYTLIAPVPGQYRVRVLLPTALDQFSPKDIGSGTNPDLNDSDINPSGSTKGFTDIYVFGSNLISITSIDAGIIKYRTPTPTRTPTPINVGNFVWHDLNGNGQQDAGEPGVPNVTVQLWNSTKTQLLDSAVTNANGNYTLVAPLPGNYRVRVLLPSPSNQFAPKDQGTGASPDSIDSDINPSGTNFGFTDIYVFGSNLISITTIDAGIIGSLPPTPTKSPTATATRTRTPTLTLTRTPTRTQTPDTSCNKKPAAPVLVSPPDFWQNQNQRMKLNWSNAQCAEFYKVIVRLKFTNGVKVDGAKVTKSKYKTVELTRHKTYHWRIKACNPPYGCSKSPWRRFSIAE